MTISASQVKELREKTGVGMMECKKALQEVNGDVDAAVKHLREKGIAKAAKKADRETKEGRIITLVSDDGQKGVLIELGCETDFVGGNESFIAFGNDLAANIINSNTVGSTEDLEGASFQGQAVKDMVSDLVLKVGENVVIRNAVVFQNEGSVSNYTHLNGKIGVLVAFEGDIDPVIGKDIAMQIAASNPQYISVDEVPKDVVDQEKEIIKNQLLNEGKPDNIVDKIVEGKIRKYFQEICLLDQVFIKDTSLVIKKVIPEDCKIKRFERIAF